MINLGNMYTNLPGLLVSFKDGGQALRFDKTEADTDSLLLLGTAMDGPVMEPVAVDDKTVELVFGSELKDNGAPNGSTLVKAFKVARDNGCKDIRLMRITGSHAKTVINAPSEEIESDVRKDETLGYTVGNSSTEVTLKEAGAIAESLSVYAKGKRLDSKLVTLNGNKVTVKENACDAGSIITVEYDFKREDDISDSNLMPDVNRTILLTKVPKTDSVKIKKADSTYLDTSKFTVDGKVVTFTEDAFPKKLKTGEALTAEYKANVEGSIIESKDSSGNTLTALSEDSTFNLSGTPRSQAEVSLYVDDTLVLDKSTYTVNLSNSSITLKSGFFMKGKKVEVSYFSVKKETIERSITISSIFGGRLYNEAKVEVMDLKDSSGIKVSKAVRITKPMSKLGTGEQPLIFSIDNFETFGSLVDAINTYSGIFKAETKTPDVNTSELLYSESYLRGGENGVNVSKEELFKALSGKRNQYGYLEELGAYQLLENYQVDSVVPCGVYADDELLDRNSNFAYELALFCAVSSYRNKSVNGTIAMKPLMDTSLAGVQAHAKYLAKFDNRFFMKDNKGSVIVDGNNDVIDLGKFITLVAGPTVTVNHKSYSLREDDGAVSYAAYNTVLLPQSAPTNKRMTGTNGVKYTFSNSQLNEIAGNRMVCFGKKFNTKGEVLKGAYIIDGVTCARPGSQYAKLSTLKVLRETADQVREAADPFIGEANTIENRNALTAAISKRLDLLVTSGVLLDYSLNLIVSQRDQVLGQANLELGVLAPEELSKITTVMGLKN